MSGIGEVMEGQLPFSPGLRPRASKMPRVAAPATLAPLVPLFVADSGIQSSTMAAMLSQTRCFTAAARAAPQRRVALVVRASSKPVQQELPAFVKPAAVAAVANMIAALPASAAGKLFDFNLTLPVSENTISINNIKRWRGGPMGIELHWCEQSLALPRDSPAVRAAQVMAGEILLLMVFLDKFWFGPVGKVLDERDSTLRNQLGSVKSGSAELDKLTSEAEALVKSARSEVRFGGCLGRWAHALAGAALGGWGVRARVVTHQMQQPQPSWGSDAAALAQLAVRCSNPSPAGSAAAASELGVSTGIVRAAALGGVLSSAAVHTCAGCSAACSSQQQQDLRISGSDSRIRAHYSASWWLRELVARAAHARRFGWRVQQRCSGAACAARFSSLARARDRCCNLGM